MNGYDEAWLADYQARTRRAQEPLVPRYPDQRAQRCNVADAGEIDAAAPTVAPAGGRPAPNKYGAVRTTAPASWGGTRTADSKAGAQLMRTLATQKLAGSVLDFWEEVSLPIGVNEQGKIIRYRADAMVLLGYTECGAMVVRFYDAKRGQMDTSTSAAKRAALRNRGLNVEVVDGKVEGVG